MSSAAYNRLQNIFKTTATASGTVSPSSTTTKSLKEKTKGPKNNITTTVIPKPKKEKLAFEPLPMSQLTDSLANLKMFIDTFKRASNTGPFRYSYKYYEEVVSHLARARQYSYIEEILQHQKRYKSDMSNESFVIRLMSLYGKSRMYEHARKLFDEMPEFNCPRTVLSANALLAACVNSKRLHEMPELFRELREELCIQPDEVSYNVVIKAFCEMDATDSALLVIDEMERNGCECSLYTYNTILDGLYGNGKISDADKLWEVMENKNIQPDVRTYNAKLRGLIVDKRINEAIELLDVMRSNGVKPDVYTYNGLINGFVKEDNLVEVKKWYEEMAKNEIVPDSVTYRIIVPFASKKGDYRFGFEMCKEGLLREINVGRSNLQGVLDGLLKLSASDESRELLKLVKASNFIYYKLKLPGDFFVEA